MDQTSSSKEAELQTLLTDERERCNQHKQLYQTLKEEHGKLKDELTFVHEKLKEAVSKNERLQSSKDNYIKKLEEQLREKQKEIFKLSEEVNSYDPERIRDSVLEEATNLYEVKINELHSETDLIRKQYSSLHYDYTVLKCKLESRESEFSHTVERLKLQHLSEIEHLQSKLESVEQERSFPDDSAALELKTAKHDILQMNAKIQGLLSECEELRAQNENLTLQLSNNSKIHLKQTADNLSSMRTLESEKNKVVMQKEVLEKELSNFQEQRRIMNNELQASRREVLSLKSQLEESEHKCQMMITNLRVENEQLKTEFQSEREQFIEEITKLKSEIRELTVSLSQMQQAIVSKEQELQQSTMLARQQLWKQSNEFQSERDNMEKKFQDFKNKKEQFIAHLTQEVEKLQQNLELCSKSKLEIEKEYFTMKENFEETMKNASTADGAGPSKQNLNYEREIAELRDQIFQLRSYNVASSEERDKLFNEMFSKKKDKIFEEENEILHLKLGWEQQKLQFHQRLEDLECRLKETKISSTNERKEFEAKIQKYARAVNKYKDKLEFLKSKTEELEDQKESLEKNVPFEVHVQVRNKLIELQRRLEEYRLIVAAEPHFSAASRTTTAPVSDKLLTDIKNLQLRLPSPDDPLQDYGAPRYGRDKMPDRPHPSKRSIYTRRKSIKTKSKEQIPRSPVITSSSDLDLENL